MYGQPPQKVAPKPKATPMPDDDREVGLDEWDDIVADRYKVPRSLMKSVRMQESGGNVNAKSPTGVRGRYQVTEATAKQYGLDRNDPWQQSVAAAKHLRKMFDETDGADDDEKWLGAVGKYYGGSGAVKNGVLSGGSVDGVSNPAEHVRRVAEKWGQYRREEGGQPATKKEQLRQSVTSLQDELVARTPQPQAPRFQPPIDMRLNAPNEAQKAFDRAAAAVQPAPQPKPRNAFQAPQPKPMLERVMAQQAVERQQPQTVETDPQRLEQLKQATGQQLAEQRDVRMQQSRANVEQMNPLQRMAVRGLAKAGGATDADIRAIAPPQGLEADLMRATNAGVRQVGSIVRGAGEALPGFLPPSVGALRKPIRQGTVGAAKNIQGGLNAVADAAAPDDPTDQSFRAKLGRGVGSVGASMGSALATGGGSLAAGTLGALGNLGQVAEERERSGVPVSGLREAGSDALAIATGMTEALGAGRLLNRLGMKTPVIQRVAQALEEGGQEYAQGYLNDINAKLVAAYDPNRALNDPLSQKRLQEALIGTILGGAGEVGDVSMQRAMAAQQNAQQRATRSAIDQRSAANAAAIAPQPAAAQPVTEPLTEPMAAQPQPSAPATPQAQPQGFPRLPEPEGFNARRAKLLGMPTPAEVNINEQVQAAAQLLDSPNEGDQRQGRRMLNKALTDLRKAEGYLAEAALPPDAPRPFTAVRDAIEARLKPKRAENETAIEPFNRIANQPLNQKRTKNELVTTASNALRAEADAAKIKAAEFEQVGDFTQAAATYQAAHQNLKRLRRSMGMPKTPEAVAQINQIDREISIADANRRKAMQAARTAQRQATAPTAGLPENPQSAIRNPQSTEAPLLRPDAVQNPEGGIPQMPEPTFTDRLEAAARRDASARGKAKPAKRLLSRIAELGGISDRYAGELQDVKDARRIGVIRQKAEMSPDVLARQLQSEGYDVDPEDLNTLWEAARRDIAGRDERTSQTSELERRLAEEEAAYNERQPFDQIVADVDAEPTNRLRDAEYEGGEVRRYSKPLEGQAVEREAFQPDTADLREVREFGKREPRTEQFTEEPPTAPLARRRATPQESPEVAALREREALPPIERREAKRQAVPKGMFGKLSESSYKGRPNALVENPQLRRLLGLGEMPEYRLPDAPINPKTGEPYVNPVWTAEAQNTLNALAELAGKERSSQVNFSEGAPHGVTGKPTRSEFGELFGAVTRLARRKGERIDPNLRLAFEETATRARGAQAGWQEFTVDERTENIRQSLYDTFRQGKLDRATDKALRDSFQSIATEYGLSDTQATNLYRQTRDEARSRAERAGSEPSRSAAATPSVAERGERVSGNRGRGESATSGRAAKSIDQQIQDIRNLVGWTIDQQEANKQIAVLEAQRPKIAERREAQPRTREDVENSPEFKRWFGDSVVTENGKPGGKPLVVYHGTDKDIEAFQDRTGRHGQFFGKGHYFAPRPSGAESFAYGEGANIVPSYLSIKNPLTVTTGTSEFHQAFALEDPADITNAARSKGHDGIIIISSRTGKPSEIIAFSPNQIKSAIGNRGTFDPASPRITERRKRTARSGFSFGRVPEGRGQVLASGLNVQGLFGRTPKPAKDAKPVPLPKDFDLAKWSQKSFNDALVNALSPKDRAEYNSLQTAREKQAYLLSASVDPDLEAKVFKLIDRAAEAYEKGDGTDFQAVRNEVRSLLAGQVSPSLRDVKWYDHLQSRLSNVNFKGTYERIAGEQGKEISEIFRNAQVDAANGKITRAEAVTRLQRELKPYIRRLKSSGKPGLARWVENHIDAVSDPDQSFKGLAGFLRGFQYNTKLRLNPRSALINTLQPFQTLWPHLTTAEWLRIQRDAARPATWKRVSEVAARESGGSIEEVNDQKRFLGWADLFSPVSEYNRIVGHLAGELFADRNGLTGDAKARMAADWAKKVEFDNSAYDIPPLFSGKIAGVVGQFKPFMVKNLERLYTDWKSAPPEALATNSWKGAGTIARRSKMVTAQLLIGGVRSAIPGLKTVGGVLVLGALAKGFGKFMDDDEAEKLAEAVYFGAPALVEQDLSGSVAIFDEPFGKTGYEKIVNFAGGPTLSLIAKAYEEGKNINEAEDSKTQTKAEKQQDAALRLAKAVTPYTKWGIAGAAAMRGERPSLWLGKEVPMTTAETVGYSLLGTPLRQSKYYEHKEAYDWQKGLMPERFEKEDKKTGTRILPDGKIDAGMIRQKVGEPEAIYKQRVERVEGWMSEYGDKLLSHPSYSLLTESQKQAAMESLRRRISAQQNAAQPRLGTLAPEKVIQSVLKSEATRPKRDAGKLWVSPATRP